MENEYQVNRSEDIQALEEFHCEKWKDAGTNFLLGTLLSLTLWVTGGFAAMRNVEEYPTAARICLGGTALLAMALCYIPSRSYKKANELLDKIGIIKRDQDYDLLNACLSESGVRPL